MPTYDYRCERTGEMFERWQSFSEDALTECPETHHGETSICGARVRKVFSKVGISFKGEGFYKTDHGGGAPPPAESGPAPTGGDSGSAPATGSSTSDTPSSTGTTSTPD